jgi:hypothetical protein
MDQIGESTNQIRGQLWWSDTKRGRGCGATAEPKILLWALAGTSARDSHVQHVTDSVYYSSQQGGSQGPQGARTIAGGFPHQLPTSPAKDRSYQKPTTNRTEPQTPEGNAAKQQGDIDGTAEGPKGEGRGKIGGM